MTAPYTKVLVHTCIADSAHAREASNVTRPFPILWVGSGDETTLKGGREGLGTRLTSYGVAIPASGWV